MKNIENPRKMGMFTVKGTCFLANLLWNGLASSSNKATSVRAYLLYLTILWVLFIIRQNRRTKLNIYLILFSITLSSSI